MEGMRSLLQICKDFVHLFVSSVSFSVAITAKFISAVFHFFYHVFYQQTKFLFRTFMWLPVTITISVLLQLIFLPFNIPLKLFAGTSLQKIIGQTNSRTNTYVIITILQYSLVLLLLGIVIGLICGATLGILHFLIVIPDWKFDISLSFIKRRLPQFSLPKIDFGFIPDVAKIFQSKPLREDAVQMPSPVSPILTRGEELEELLAKTATTPYRVNRKKSWQRRSSSSKESVMEIASKLPSDFFQKRGSISEEKQVVYQTPSQSPSSKTVDDSSYSSSNLWDQFDELPSTLRTEGGLSTLYSRRPLGATSRGETIYVPKLKNRN